MKKITEEYYKKVKDLLEEIEQKAEDDRASISLRNKITYLVDFISAIEVNEEIKKL